MTQEVRVQNAPFVAGKGGDRGRAREVGPRQALQASEALPETQKMITDAQVDQLLKDYYRQRGWDNQDRPPEKPV